MPAPSNGTLALAALKALGSPRYREMIRDALTEEKGNVPLAAVALDTDIRTLQRYLADDPSLTDGITLQKRGWPRGRPRKPTKKKNAP